MDVEGVEHVHWISLFKNAIGLQFGPSEFEVVAHRSGKMEGLEALRDAVRQLSTTADQIDVDRRKLKTRQQTDRKVRLAYSRNTGRL